MIILINRSACNGLKRICYKLVFRIGCFGYVAIGVYQFFAMSDGIGHITGFGGFISNIIAMLLCQVPLINSALALTGAIKVWGWTWPKALMWYFILPFAFMFFFVYIGKKVGMGIDNSN